MAMFTNGFVGAIQLSQHFANHGPALGVHSVQEYEKRADRFLGGPKPSHVQEYKRSKGDVLRYDTITQEFGVVDRFGTIRTYFKPVPCSSLPASIRAAEKKAGRCHGHATNQDYFSSECKRW